MIFTLFIYLAVAVVQLLIWVLPTLDIVPDVFTTILAQAVAFCWGLNWLLPIDQIFTALTVSFTIDLIILGWIAVRWLIGWLPFLKHQ